MTNSERNKMLLGFMQALVYSDASNIADLGNISDYIAIKPYGVKGYTKKPLTEKQKANRKKNKQAKKQRKSNR